VAVTTKSAQSNRSGQATRGVLIDVAERLFAERGIDAVSVAEILVESGQRNKNAVTYHFGGREGLIIAIAEERSGALNDRRNEVLADLDASGASNDVRSLCTALVIPLAELLDAPNQFLGFLARYHLDRSRRRLVASVDPRVTKSYRVAYEKLREASGIGRREFDLRFDFALDLIFTALAGRQSEERTGRPAGASRNVFVATLTDCVAGCFTRSVTPG
jgi:AcrR family transcriptional regulator